MLLTEILAFRSRPASPISSPAWHWRRRSAKWLRSTDPSPHPTSFAISPSVLFFIFIFLLDLCYNSSFLLLRQENYKMTLFLLFLWFQEVFWTVETALRALIGRRRCGPTWSTATSNRPCRRGSGFRWSTVRMLYTAITMFLAPPSSLTTSASEPPGIKN